MARPENICFFYLPFSGGKFLINCLSLSRHVAVNRPDLAKKDFEFPIHNEEYYKLKLKLVMESLPMDFHVKGWWKEFAGLDCDRTYDEGMGHVVDQARELKKTVCHVAHFSNELDEYLTKYPDTKVVKLLNFKKFNSLCFTMKAQTTDLERHEQGFDWWLENTPNGNITVDVDGCMYDPNIFRSEIEKLYDFFELDDFNFELIEQFYKTYRWIHQIT